MVKTSVTICKGLFWRDTDLRVIVSRFTYFVKKWTGTKTYISVHLLHTKYGTY